MIIPATGGDAGPAIWAAVQQRPTQIEFEAGAAYIVQTPQGGSSRAALYLSGLADIEFVGNGAQITTTIPGLTVLEVADSTRVDVHGIRLQGQGANNGDFTDANFAGSAVRYTNVAHGRIYKNWVTNAAASAIYLTGGTRHTTVEDNIIHDCSGNGINEDCLGGTVDAPDAPPRHNAIVGNHLIKVGVKLAGAAGAIVLDNGWCHSFTKVADNHIEVSEVAGLWLPDIARCTITGNHITNTAWWGVRMFSWSGDVPSGTGNVVTGNQIGGCATSSGTPLALVGTGILSPNIVDGVVTGLNPRFA